MVRWAPAAAACPGVAAELGKELTIHRAPRQPGQDCHASGGATASIMPRAKSGTRARRNSYLVRPEFGRDRSPRRSAATVDDIHQAARLWRLMQINADWPVWLTGEIRQSNVR